ncbi:peptidoglycan DD-metalloendopeptidase family protein [Phyllobacterium sp. 628]|nr:peptidoglycan DD-metalloendopeptidase family protein [Phyllobacterium sp. 628]
MKKAKHSPIFSNRQEPHTIIIARGETIRHFTLRPWAAILGGTLAFALAGTYLIATSYLVFRDDLISGSVARQARLQQAYEDRIANLRTQLDQVTSRQMLDQQLMDTKVAELIQRQKSLTERHDKLVPLLQRAEHAGAAIPPEADNNAPMDSNGDDVVKAEDDGFYGIDPIITGPTTATRKPVPPREDDKSKRGVDKAELLLKKVNTSLTDIEAKQVAQMQALSNTAYENADKIMEALAATGVKPELDGKSDTGGPFIPAGSVAPFDAKLNDLDQALERLEGAKALAKTIPISNPVPGMPVSSTFGVRKDPIIGSMAFHSGIDFRAISGSSVKATANGTVTEAGYNGGYGNMVEIDHGNGLSTRYGHMSQILVSVGQKISIGDVVGKVGSTGRSTGPHLHYEVRRNGTALNPAGFLTVGREVAAEL